MADTDLIGARYELREPMGSDDVGTLYLAYDQRRGIEAVIALAPEGRYSQAALAAFTHTAQNVATLSGIDGLAPIVDFGFHEGRPYQVTPYTGAEPLHTFLAGAPFYDEGTLNMLANISYALDEAHSRGIVHGAVTPLSIVIDRNSRDRLWHFGMLPSVEEAGIYSSVLPAYMAPERADGGPITPQSDVYALGVTLYQCLTGQLPYQASSRMMMVMAQVSKPVPNLNHTRPDLPPDVQQVINLALAKEPSVRYQSAGELYEAFARVHA
jgi:serine/threonine-protein kinase